MYINTNPELKESDSTSGVVTVEGNGKLTRPLGVTATVEITYGEDFDTSSINSDKLNEALKDAGILHDIIE